MTKEERSRYMRVWRRKNRTRYQAWRKTYYQKNRERILAQQRPRNAANLAWTYRIFSRRQDIFLESGVSAPESLLEQWELQRTGWYDPDPEGA